MQAQKVWCKKAEMESVSPKDFVFHLWSSSYKPDTVKGLEWEQGWGGEKGNASGSDFQFGKDYSDFRISLVAQTIKNLPAMEETWVWSLGQEDLLEKEMATHSSMLAWRIPWTEEPRGLQSMGSQRVGQDLATKSPLPCLLHEYLQLLCFFWDWSLNH